LDQEDRWLWGAVLEDRAQLTMGTARLCLLEDCRIFPYLGRINHWVIENKTVNAVEE
jgi:hypothetical protein